MARWIAAANCFAQIVQIVSTLFLLLLLFDVPAVGDAAVDAGFSLGAFVADDDDFLLVLFLVCSISIGEIVVSGTTLPLVRESVHSRKTKQKRKEILFI